MLLVCQRLPNFKKHASFVLRTRHLQISPPEMLKHVLSIASAKLLAEQEQKTV